GGLGRGSGSGGRGGRAPRRRPPPPPAGRADRWRARLGEPRPLDEAESLALCAAYGVPTLPWRIAEDRQGAVAAAREIGFPAVLKTAMPGILHKTERDGVRLGLAGGQAGGQAYQDMAAPLGPPLPG